MALSGYHPEIRYTKLIHGDRGETIVLCFDKNRKMIGHGGLMDNIHFKYIDDEARRVNPDQVVNKSAFYSMPQDTAEIRIVPKSTKMRRSR